MNAVTGQQVSGDTRGVRGTCRFISRGFPLVHPRHQAWTLVQASRARGIPVESVRTTAHFQRLPPGTSTATLQFHNTQQTQRGRDPARFPRGGSQAGLDSTDCSQRVYNIFILQVPHAGAVRGIACDVGMVYLQHPCGGPRANPGEACPGTPALAATSARSSSYPVGIGRIHPQRGLEEFTRLLLRLTSQARRGTLAAPAVQEAVRL